MAHQPKRQKDGPLSVMYVEVNNTNFVNTGCYSLASTSDPLFDIGIIFAANINYDIQERRAVLHYNANVTKVLDNADIYIRPLQEKGIKVLLSILGNHQGAGICNFPDPISARDFAKQLNQAVRQYGLDGIDFDDEYARYGENGTGQPNADSFLWLLRELRGLLEPEKIISFYYYGPAASRLISGDLNAGDYLDYSWNAIYGTWSVPNVPKLAKSQLSPAAVHVQQTSLVTAQFLATRTMDEDYGVYLCYDLPNTNINNYFSGVAQRLYGVDTTLENGCLQPWIPGGEKKILEEEIERLSIQKEKEGTPIFEGF